MINTEKLQSLVCCPDLKCDVKILDLCLMPDGRFEVIWTDDKYLYKTIVEGNYTRYIFVSDIIGLYNGNNSLFSDEYLVKQIKRLINCLTDEDKEFFERDDVKIVDVLLKKNGRYCLLIKTNDGYYIGQMKQIIPEDENNVKNVCSLDWLGATVFQTNDSEKS